MSLSHYHQQFKEQSDERIQHKLEIKEQELLTIWKEISRNFDTDPVRIAVLGCGDARFVKGHTRIFEKLLSGSVELTTFDISIEHLEGEERIIQHDCSNALPNAPFSIVYSHALLKFIEPDKQFRVLKHSFNALSKGGVAIHVLDQDEIDQKTVDLDVYRKQLQIDEVVFQEISLEYGSALVLLKD